MDASHTEGLVNALIDELQEAYATNAKVRSHTVERLYEHLSQTPPSVPLYIDMDVLLTSLYPLLCDANFKIVLTVMQIMEVLVKQYARDVLSHIDDLLSYVTERWSDTKVAVRQAVSKVVSVMFSVFPTKIVLDHVLKHVTEHPAWRVREESINMIIWVMSTHERDSHLDFKMICMRLCKALQDARPKVKFVALEALAVVRFRSPAAIERIKTFLNGEEQELLEERFAEGELPTCRNDGIVEHKLLSQSDPIITHTAPSSHTPLSSANATYPEGRNRVQSAAVNSRPLASRGQFPWDNMPSTTTNRVRRKPSVSDETSQHHVHPPPAVSVSPTRAAFAAFLPVTPGGYNEFPSPSSSVSVSPIEQSPTPVTSSSLSASNKISLWLPGGSVEYVDTRSSISSNGTTSSDDPYHSLFSNPAPVGSSPSTKASAESVASQPNSLPARRKLLPATAGTISHPVVPTQAPKSTNDGSSGSRLGTAFDVEAGHAVDALSIPSSSNVGSSTPSRRSAVETAARPMDEIPTDQLDPLAAGREFTELNKALDGLKHPEWSEVYRSINIIRQAVVHHAGVFPSSRFHAIVLSLLAQVDNLRSAISKNAITCIGEMFRFMSKTMEPEAEICARVLLKKTGETNKFIVQAAEDSLESMVECLLPAKAINALLSSVSHKAPAVRARCAKYLRLTIETSGSLPMPDRVVPAVNNFLTEGLAETRQEARTIVQRIMTTCDDDSWKRHLADRDVRKWLEFAGKVSQTSYSSGRRGSIGGQRERG